MALSDHGVGLPVPEASPAVGDFGPGLTVHPVVNAAGVARAAVALAVLLSMAAQVQEQVVARVLVLQHVLMDRLMGDGFPALLFQASGALLRAPVLPQQTPDTGLHRRGHLDGLGFDGVALSSLAVGLLVALAPEPPVTGELPADTGLAAAQSLVMSPADFAKMQPGTILVCPMTTPAWTQLFSQAKGLVTDIGSILTHGSIVAREYNIPAVLGLGIAPRGSGTGS
jgi:hypothetical protein